MALSKTVSTISKSPNNIRIYRGESRTIDIFADKELDEEYLELLGETKREPIDLTDKTLIFTVVDTEGNELIRKTSNKQNEIDILDPPTNGEAKIFIKTFDTYALDDGTYIFDVWAEGGGRRFPIVELSEFVLISPATRL